MDANKFKLNLRKVVNQNKLPISFEIVGEKLEKFHTKMAFGKRILELLEDSRLSDIKLEMVKEKGFYGNMVSGLITCLIIDWQILN